MNMMFKPAMGPIYVRKVENGIIIGQWAVFVSEQLVKQLTLSTPTGVCTVLYLFMATF